MKVVQGISPEDIRTTPKSSKSVGNHITPTGSSFHQSKTSTPLQLKERDLMITTPVQGKLDMLKTSTPIQDTDKQMQSSTPVFVKHGQQLKTSTPMQAKATELETTTQFQDNQEQKPSRHAQSDTVADLKVLDDESLDDLDFTEDFDDDNIMPELNTDTPTSYRSVHLLQCNSDYFSNLSSKILIC